MQTRARCCEWKAAIPAAFVSMLLAVPSVGQSACETARPRAVSVRGENRECPRELQEGRVEEVSEAALVAEEETPAGTEGRSGGAAATTDALLGQMSLAAGVIFAGEVVAVRRPGGAAGSGQAAAEGVVEVDLRVDDALRGPAAGSIYTLREWAGLWAGLARRYRVGQRLLLFLYSPGRDGLSAPVRGAEGAIPLHGSGTAPGPDESAATRAEWLVDLRWLHARVLRSNHFVTWPERRPVFPLPGGGLETSGPGLERAGDRSSPDSRPRLLYASAPADHRRRTTAVEFEAQPLSQVLALCDAAITLDAKRRRDAGQ